MSEKFQPHDQVRLLGSILEDRQRKANHFLYERIFREDRTGDLVTYESSERYKGVLVTFHYGKILVREDDIALSN